MNKLRGLSTISGSGHMTPHSSSLASASAARMQARVSWVVSINSPIRSSTCGRWRVAEGLGHQQCQRRARTRIWRGSLPPPDAPNAPRNGSRVAVALSRSTSPSRNTRSHGTITSSKKTTQSISSKREPSGWSKCERPEIEAVAAQEFEPRRAAGDRKAQRERAVAFGVARHARRIDPDLVGERPQGRENARAAHDDAGIGLAHHLRAPSPPAG